nr:winged helix-turn-helix domain-containing protein [Paeniclostridium sordellii]
MKIDFNSRNIFINDEKINLTVTEYNLLKLLSKNKGRTITKEVILKKLWDNKGNYVDENAISTNIRRLRQKLGDDSKNSKYISTVFGIGYVMGE